jgi:hypothetical protein
MLAGASYLDMIWYGVSVDHVSELFIATVKKIDKVLDNIKLPVSNNDIKLIADGWRNIQVRKYGFDAMKGTLFAGDGLVIEIQAPSSKDLKRMKLTIDKFRNRKGCFGLITQAFCDSNGIFTFLETSWPGGTNDLTAYMQTSLYHTWQNTNLYEGYHMVLDAIYSTAF